MNKTSLSIVVPAYKSSQFILDTVMSRVEALRTLNIAFELIVVLDGVDRQAEQQLQKAKIPEMKLFHYKENQGKGFAVKYGMSKAVGAYVGYIDAGTDLDSKLLVDMYQTITNAELDFVIPSKLHPESSVDYPNYRRAISSILRFANRVLFGMDISDTQVGAKLYKAEIIESILEATIVSKFAFEMEMLFLARKAGFTEYTDVPVDLQYDFSSTVRLIDVLVAAVDTVKVWLVHRVLPTRPEYKFSQKFSRITLV